MPSRWVTVIVFALIAAGAFVFFSTGADSSADEIIGAAEANEALAESAPQQQVVATWAIRDAEVTQVRQDGIRNGLLGVCAAMLASIAVSIAWRERREQTETGVQPESSVGVSSSND
jgi:uncharacterized membrane protein YedE/YeeE